MQLGLELQFFLQHTRIRSPNKRGQLHKHITWPVTQTNKEDSYTNRSFQAELRMGTGYGVYTVFPGDGCELCAALFLGIAEHSSPSTAQHLLFEVWQKSDALRAMMMSDL